MESALLENADAPVHIEPAPVQIEDAPVQIESAPCQNELAPGQVAYAWGKLDLHQGIFVLHRGRLKMPLVRFDSGRGGFDPEQGWARMPCRAFKRKP